MTKFQYLFWCATTLGDRNGKWYLDRDDRQYTPEGSNCRDIVHIYNKTSSQRSGFPDTTYTWEVSTIPLWNASP